MKSASVEEEKKEEEKKVEAKEEASEVTTLKSLSMDDVF
jgi:hypothetical protein